MNTTLTVNNHTLIDGDLGEWQQRNPHDYQHLINPTPDQPWIRAALLTLTTAALNNTGHITIKIKADSPTDWAMKVTS